MTETSKHLRNSLIYLVAALLTVTLYYGVAETIEKRKITRFYSFKWYSACLDKYGIDGHKYKLMRQQILEASEFERFRKKTRKEQFLEEMEQVIPWAELCTVKEPS